MNTPTPRSNRAVIGNLWIVVERSRVEIAVLEIKVSNLGGNLTPSDVETAMRLLDLSDADLPAKLGPQLATVKVLYLPGDETDATPVVSIAGELRPAGAVLAHLATAALALPTRL